MPGYEPFLLCDFHVHTTWSDGRLSLGDTIDLYGRTGKFDVIAITDHILMKRDWLARAGRVATLGRRTFGIAEHAFPSYLEALRREAERARATYDMLVIPGAEITQNRLRGGCPMAPPSWFVRARARSISAPGPAGVAAEIGRAHV